jgi:long-chain acyl-CoA synthetase
MIEGYGLTETSPALAFSTPSTQDRLGRPGDPRVEIRIDNPNEEGIGGDRRPGPQRDEGLLQKPRSNQSSSPRP